MSDKELEVQEEEVLESQDAEQLEESPKAPKKESVKSTKKEEEDMESDEEEDDMEDSEEEGDDDDEEEASESKKKSVKESAAPKTKAGMIQAMMDIVSGMKKDELAAQYGKITSAMNGDEEDEEEATESKKSVREVKKVTKEDINVKEDVAAIFNGEDLTEDFTTKATTIFEAAVLSKVNEVLESVTVDFEAELEAEKSSIQEDLSKKLDDYLEYVAEEWMKENELAVEQGVRAEIVENFMVGLRNLFTENYIDIPEEKVDLVDELAAKVGELETAVNEEMEKNIELRKELTEGKKESVMRDASKDLTESQIIKLKSLAEGVDFESEEDFQTKIDTIRENYFAEAVASDSGNLDDEPLEFAGNDVDQAVADPGMQAYMSAISRSIKK
jgi:hypothetical protein